MNEDKVFGGVSYGPNDNQNLYVGRLPGRKSICLYQLNGNGSELITRAFFSKEEDALAVMSFLYGLIRKDGPK